MEILTGLFVLFAAVVVYFLPALLASNRKHPSASAIFLLNLLAGWTVLFWLICLVWAFTGENRRTIKGNVTDKRRQEIEEEELIRAEARKKAEAEVS